MDNAKRIDINALFIQRPTLRATARTLLEQSFKEKYPQETAVIDDLRLSEKIYATVDGTTQFMRYTMTPLLDVFIQNVCQGRPAHYVQNHHYLMQHSENAPHSLRVRMDDISRMLNDCADLLIETYKQALVNFWSKPCDFNYCVKSPAEELSEIFQLDMYARTIALPDKSNEEEYRQANLLLLCITPERKIRFNQASSSIIRAYIADIDLLIGHDVQHIEIASALIIRGSFKGVHTLALYTPAHGIEFFESMDQIGLVLSKQVGLNTIGTYMQWRLYEPPGNAFLYLAMLILERQLHQIDNAFRLTLSGNRGMLYLEPQLEEITLPAGRLENLTPEEAAQYQQLSSSLPGWLTNASAADRTTYGKWTHDLAQLQERTNGQSFMDEIPPIREFAAQAVLKQMHQDHPEITLTLDDLDVRMAVVPPGSPALPTTDNEVLISTIAPEKLLEDYAVYTPIDLAELALINLCGKPDGFITVRSKWGKTLPDWLAPNSWATHKYLSNLIETVDAGTQYIALLKSKLVTDPVESARRQTLFTNQLRLQLPMLALQNKLCKEAGFTDLGVRYIEAVMQDVQEVDGKNIVIKKLSFIPAPGWEEDTVTNMFVIGPTADLPGPQILYRPQATVQLQEFTSRDALLDAIVQPGKLQTEVIAWLSDRNRPTYENKGFDEPHLQRFSPNVEVSFSTSRVSGPVVLGDNPLTGNALNQLFQANTLYLIELADRSSVSTAESRWALIKETGWLLFTNVLPLLSGPVAVAGWLLFSFIELYEIAGALDEGNTDKARQIFIDYLFNVGSVLLFHRLEKFTPQIEPGLMESDLADRTSAPRNPIETIEEPETPPQTHSPSISHPPLELPIAPENQTPGASHCQLDYRWKLQYSLLTKAQKSNFEKLLGDYASPYKWQNEKRITSGANRGLYTISSDFYAAIRDVLYRTASDDSGRFIVGHFDPKKTGPRIRHDADFNWDFDLGLSLKGGGPKKIAELRKQKFEKIQILRNKRELINQQIINQQKEINANRADYNKHINKNGNTIRKLNNDYKQLAEKITANYENYYLAMNEEHLLEPISGLETKQVQILEDEIQLSRNLRELLEDEILDILNENPMFATEQSTHAFLETGGANAIKKMELFFMHRVISNEAAVKCLSFELAKMEEMTQLPKIGFARAAELGGKTVLVANLVGWKSYLLTVIFPLIVSSSAELLLKIKISPILNKVLWSADLTALSQRELIISGLDQSYEAADVLNNSILKYQKAESTLKQLSTDPNYAQHLRPRYLNRVLELIEDFRLQAEQKLKALLEENPMLLKPAAVKKTPSSSSRTPAAKSNSIVISTSDEGSLVAELQPMDSGRTNRKASINNPIDKSPLAIYEESPNNDIWVKVETTQPPSAPPATPPKGLKNLQAEARALLQGVEKALQDNLKSAGKPDQIPIDIQDILQNKANKLNAQANDIDQTISLSNTNGSSIPKDTITTLTGLANDLRKQAARMAEQAKATRIKMIKDQDPEPGRVHFLVEQGEARIYIEGPRVDPDGKGEDFIQEYAIVDKDGNPLWYAHFHYPKLDTPLEGYEAAHIKTVKQRFIGRRALVAMAKNNKKIDTILRSEISPKMARILFLSLHDTLAAK